MKALSLPGGEALLDERFLDQAEAGTLLAVLTAGLPWEQEKLRLFGRLVPVPRLVSYHGDPEAAYVYSGVLHEPKPWTPALADLRARVVRACGERFNSVLANLYRDGRDGMSWHADDEPELGPEPAIASVSLGAPRSFRLKRRDGSARLALELGHGALLLMRGETQRLWVHAVPKTRRAVGPRLNLTFRLVRGRG